MESRVHLLFVLTGYALEPRCKYGDFDAHFHGRFQPDHTIYPICEDWPNVPLPDLTGFDGIIFAGSTSLFDEREPWLNGAIELMSLALRSKKPLLGVCFGHQLLAKVCGAEIGPNPQGRANGTIRVSIIDRKDPLFSHLPEIFDVQVSHRDVILVPTPAFKVIGHAAHDACHVIRAGERAWGVQFHPEWTMSIARAYIEARRSVLDREPGNNTADRMLASLRDTSAASSILQQFVKICEKSKNR